LKRAKTDPSLESGPMREGVQPVHRLGSGEPGKGMWISEGAHILSPRCFIYFVCFAFSTIFGLFRKML